MMMIKAVLLALLLCITLTKAHPVFLNCLQEHKMTREEYTKYTRDSKDPNYIVERRFKCFTKCLQDAFFEKDDNGQYTSITGPAFKGEDIFGSASFAIRNKDCNDKLNKIEDNCEYAYLYNVCMTNKDNFQIIYNADSINK